MAAQVMPTVVPNPRDLINYIINEGHGVKGLSEMGLETVPEQFIQPIEERELLNKIVPEESIPVIDVSDWEDPKVGNQICNAAEECGFFQIVNHGVPLEVLENVKAATRRFFELPAEEKKKYLREHSPSKNVRLTTSFIPAAEKALEWKDYISIFYVSDEEAAAFWPSVLKKEALEHMKWCTLVGRKLLEVLMKRLHVKEMDETKESLFMGSKRMNIICYPKCPKPELTVGVGRHSDVSTLTLLLQDDVGGLYVRKSETEEWIGVPPVSGALVINIGDALEIMSNGRYKSIEHRVAANGSKDRVSVPVFVNPRPSDVIGPLAEVLKSGEKPKYKPVLCSEYTKHFFQKPHNGKDTLDYARI